MARRRKIVLGRWSALPAVIAGLGLFAGCSAHGATGTAHAAMGTAFAPGLGGLPTPVAASFGRENFGYTSTLPSTQEANLYRLMVLQSTDAAVIPALHKANPRLKIFVYQDDLLGRTADAQGLTVCTAWTTSTGQSSWFVKDQHGNRIIDSAYPGNYIMDVGNTAYRHACVAHAIAQAKAGGFDGVYFDDVSPNVSWGLFAGITTPQYPTPTAWQAAMYGFLQYASAQVHGQHLLLMGNIGGSVNYPGLWGKWSTLFDGTEEQSFTDSGTGVAASLWAWPAQLANAAWSQAKARYALLHSYSTTEAGNTFGLATMLLVGNGEDLYSTANANFQSDERWYPEYTTAEMFGTPTGAYTKLSNGVYRRVFTKGMVLVNPTTSSVEAFSVGGGIYSGSGLTNVKSVTLGPASALILARVG